MTLVPHSSYVHGYDAHEQVRLVDQATTLGELFHRDTRYPDGARVLEVGCGVGAQTVLLARGSPGATFTAIDIAPQALGAAHARVRAAGIANVTFQQADVFDLPFAEASFDHIFICFVLEHLPRPGAALKQLRSRLKPGGSLTVIEGDYGSTFFHPDNADARRVIGCLVELQARAGGDGMIGRRLFSLLERAGLRDVVVSPRTVYVDASRPEWVQGFVQNTFTAMIEGVREQALAAGLVDTTSWERGIAGLRRTADSDGSFCSTFFKATAVK